MVIMNYWISTKNTMKPLILENYTETNKCIKHPEEQNVTTHLHRRPNCLNGNNRKSQLTSLMNEWERTRLFNHTCKRLPRCMTRAINSTNSIQVPHKINVMSITVSVPKQCGNLIDILNQSLHAQNVHKHTAAPNKQHYDGLKPAVLPFVLGGA